MCKKTQKCLLTKWKKGVWKLSGQHSAVFLFVIELQALQEVLEAALILLLLLDLTEDGEELFNFKFLLVWNSKHFMSKMPYARAEISKLSNQTLTILKYFYQSSKSCATFAYHREPWRLFMRMGNFRQFVIILTDCGYIVSTGYYPVHQKYLEILISIKRPQCAGTNHQRCLKKSLKFEYYQELSSVTYYSYLLMAPVFYNKLTMRLETRSRLKSFQNRCSKSSVKHIYCLCYGWVIRGDLITQPKLSSFKKVRYKQICSLLGNYLASATCYPPPLLWNLGTCNTLHQT